MSAGSLKSIIFELAHTFSSACLASTPTVGHLYTRRVDQVAPPCGVIINRSKDWGSVRPNTTVQSKPRADLASAARLRMLPRSSPFPR